jgi:hypothetical protein
VQEDGSFEVSGVPAELIHLNLQLPNYRFAATNPNLDPATRRDLVGRVDGNPTRFNILLEPGQPPNWNDLERPSEEDLQHARQAAVRGVP